MMKKNHAQFCFHSGTSETIAAPLTFKVLVFYFASLSEKLGLIQARWESFEKLQFQHYFLFFYGNSIIYAYRKINGTDRLFSLLLQNSNAI
jgi:hypothetical protein